MAPGGVIENQVLTDEQRRAIIAQLAKLTKQYSPHCNIIQKYKERTKHKALHAIGEDEEYHQGHWNSGGPNSKNSGGYAPQFQPGNHPFNRDHTRDSIRSNSSLNSMSSLSSNSSWGSTLSNGSDSSWGSR